MPLGTTTEVAHTDFRESGLSFNVSGCNHPHSWAVKLSNWCLAAPLKTGATTLPNQTWGLPQRWEFPFQTRVLLSSPFTKYLYYHVTLKRSSPQYAFFVGSSIDLQLRGTTPINL